MSPEARFSSLRSCCFSLICINANQISLGFGLLLRHNSESDDADLDSVTDEMKVCLFKPHTLHKKLGNSCSF